MKAKWFITKLIAATSMVSILFACDSPSQTDLKSLTGASYDTIATTTTSALVPSYVKIVAASPLNNSTSYPTTSISVGTAINLRAVLVNASGTYIKDIEASWYVSGTLSPSNLSVSNPSATASFAPTSASAGTIQAIVVDGALISANNIISTSGISGVITATTVAATNVISIFSGNSQSATQGTTLTNPLSVKVVDNSGNPVSGVTVTFAVSSGGGSIVTSPATVNTDSSGLASATVSLGSAVGEQTFTASIPAGSTTSVTFTENSIATPTPTPTPFPSETISVFGGNSQTGAVSSQLTNPLIAKVVDVNGNPVSGVAVFFTVISGGGSITTAQPVTTDSNGQVSSLVTLGASAGTNTYRATMAVGTTKTATFTATGSTSSTMKVMKIVASGAGAQSEVTNVAASVGNPVSFKAALFDLSGTYLSDTTAIWTFSNLTFPSADLASGSSVTTNTFTPSRPGTVLVNAIYTGADTSVIGSFDSTGVFTVTNVQTPSSVLLTGGTGQTGVVNNNLTNPLQIKVFDSFSQPIQGVSVTFSVTQGSGSIIGTNPVVTDASGMASATVKLGTVTGGSNNTYRATVDGYPSLYVDYSSTATAGPQDHLTFVTQPALMFASTAFGVQPSIQLRDAYNNLVSASGTITMSKLSGTGTLSGTLTATMTSGVATFSNLSYNTAESGVVLRATNGTVTGDSNTLTVGSAPPGACAVNDSSFVTATGGCLDNATGLTWSSISTATMTWYAAIWDNLLAGAAAMDADDYGRGNDYSEVSGEDCMPTSTNSGLYTCDNSSNTRNNASINTGAYCKTLNEGGKTDWRVPSKVELLTLYGDGGATHLNNTLNGGLAQALWS